ncbi:3-ketosteroid 9alpha-monooxygenase subunit B [Streptomyces sp. CG 926]|uniref:ferredoxin--NADP reductase n=1 Tax=Streptomyces sp. CG 926 TaxID=1882405 RepID=UPI000D6C53D2|nr:ferredoxin--NADP reductase [Streptomyces sp. CG 926]PWK66117.1 3-ketosteroid 9alpha-monooxygenase subunit B [Streptomyces sp. CG 926]
MPDSRLREHDTAAPPGGATIGLRVRVGKRVQETPDAVSLVLDAELPYRPGQFLTVRIPGGAARCYSLASSPHTGEPMRITVKRVPGGLGSGWICEEVAAGDELEVLPPAGTFTPGPGGLDRDLLLMAGGSGITPVLSLAKSALAAGRGRVTLVYANRDAESVIFRDELWGLAEAHPGRLAVVHWLESLQGLPTAALLGPLLAPYASREAYLCGPGPFMDAAEAALRRAGAAPREIHRERYFSLGADVFAAGEPGPAAPRPGAPRPAEPGPDEPATERAIAEVQLDGTVHTVPWAAGTPLLDALLAAGLPAPYSCREGACSACCCRIVEGEVEMARNEVLDEVDLAEGYILACQALRLGADRVRITYEG